MNVNVVLFLRYMTADAELMSPSEPVCPGNRVIFPCQQSGAIARWTITLPSVTLKNTAQSSQTGLLNFTTPADPGFNFEIHIVSFSSNILTTELQVTAVRELDGVTVECDGSSGFFMSTIQVASVGELTFILIPYNNYYNMYTYEICRPSSYSKWSHGNQ
jgi:hypothetical protein